MEKHTALRSHFLLNPEITFLNFGSFGACPKPIFDDYQRWQLELEREPVQFIAVNSAENLKKSREALAGYIHCSAHDLVLVPNPSYAVNTVAKSLDLSPGDEILATNIEYGACDRVWEFVCKMTGAKYVRQHISLPVISKEAFIEDFFKGLTSKTKMIFISQITSTTGLILPVKEICEVAKSKGLMTFIDGAHVPGQIPLDLSELSADFYTGACHKWMLTPKGCSFLYVKSEFQPLDPLVVSWGYNAAFPSDSLFLDYHQMSGTRDFSAYLTIPKAIEFMKQNNWSQVASDCRKLVQENALRFCDLLGSKPLAPVTDEFIAQLFSIPIQTEKPEMLQRHLYEKYRIEIPVMRQESAIYLRYSINAFNTQKDLDYLYESLMEIIERTDLLRQTR